MALLNPILPPYDIAEWKKKPFAERVKMVCQSWALQGYGTPSPIYIVYILKIVFYVWMWTVFCSFTPGLGELRDFGSWYFEPIAFKKAVLWRPSKDSGSAAEAGRSRGATTHRSEVRSTSAGPARSRCPFFQGFPFLAVPGAAFSTS
jgi:hypothetical protein